MKIQDLNKNGWYGTIINHRTEIQNLVVSPLIKCCEQLYDLNVPICMSLSSNNKVFLVIDTDLLSADNKNVLQSLMKKLPNNMQTGKFSPLDEHNEAKIIYQINDNTSFEEVEHFFNSIASQFKMQDVESYIDEEHFLKNVYTIPDMVYRFLTLNTCQEVERDFNSDKIKEFLLSMGYKKIKAETFDNNYFKYSLHYNTMWMDNDIDQTVKSDRMMYARILETKGILFGDKPIDKENFKIDGVLQVLNQYAKCNFGEQYIFNSEDKRFYLNQELLDKHNKYLQYKTQTTQAVCEKE